MEVRGNAILAVIVVVVVIVVLIIITTTNMMMIIFASEFCFDLALVWILFELPDTYAKAACINMGTDSTVSIAISACTTTMEEQNRTPRYGQLGMARSLLPARHRQVTSVKSKPPSHHRTTQHDQFATGTSCHGELEGDLVSGRESGWAECKLAAAATRASVPSESRAGS